MQVEQDFRCTISSEADLLFTKWPTLASSVLSYADKMDPSWKQHLNVAAMNISALTEGTWVRVRHFVFVLGRWLII